MSISVSRESISKLMGELVDTFPMEAEGRSSISDFGKLLFTEGQSLTSSGSSGAVAHGETHSGSNRKNSRRNSGGAVKASAASPGPIGATGSKRVFTEIKGIPRQKQHDIMKTKDKAVPKRWTQEEDDRLREAVGRHGERNWKSIAEEVPGRNHTQCLQRWTKVLAPGLVKGHWRPDEDELLKELVAEGRKNWGQVATRIPGRTSKQCRERWYNHLDPSIIRGEYTVEEDRMILDAQARLGNRWSAIAAMLPGRTEDAVKIRWKSLCRVRKGQGRRGQADKNKISPRAAIMGLPGPMLHHGGADFDETVVKSEEVAGYSMHSQQHQGVHMVRLPTGQMVPASSMQSGGRHGHQNHQIMVGGNGMMYPPGASGGGGYDPTMAHYRKPPMQQHVLNGSFDHVALPPTGSMTGNHAQNLQAERRSNINYSVERRSDVEYSEHRPDMDYSVDRRTAIPSSNVAASPQSRNGYRQGYSGPSSTYASSMNNGMYSTTGPLRPLNNGQIYGSAQQLDTYRPGAIFGTPASSHEPQQMHPLQPQMMPYNYGIQSGTSSTEGMHAESSANHSMLSVNNGMSNPVATFAQQQHRQREPHQYSDTSVPMPHPNSQQQQLHRPAQHYARLHDQDQQNAEKESPEPYQNHVEQSGTNEEEHVEYESTPGFPPTSSGQAISNPAAMFAHSQAAAAPPTAGGGNPVAAFLRMQHHQKDKEQLSSASKVAQAGLQRPYNPAAAFVQRFQAGQKVPMPRVNCASFSKPGEDVSHENDDGESGPGYRSNEPSFKKVKPRLSIDAARASAARRIRNSGSGGSLAGRGSLDVFLNEIGDVGRLSDLKMDEFQTLEELWRVSGDMDRLSL
ncbi:unnamed protein product [Hyaloperonospora brassicae]|uniref:Uncharacterized protein n=1 Tax=Hyaloperonospora brassicae TaxID=162125 RepID=A0AAV0TJ57_HYABA|nr:unnamed protein product [Hyaloperonospora brassicae]